MAIDQSTSTLDLAKLDTLVRRVGLEVSDGRLPSAQVAVGHGGELVAFAPPAIACSR